jgi:cytochrome c
MFKLLLTVSTLAAPAQAALAQGAPAAGEAAFRQCQSCHVVADDGGVVLAGRNARTGPNLYGIAGRRAAGVEGFRYGSGILEAGEKGLVWDEPSFVAYVQDPTGFLRAYTGNPKARGKMTYKLRNEQDARDLWAYLASLDGLTN